MTMATSRIAVVFFGVSFALAFILSETASMPPGTSRTITINENVPTGVVWAVGYRDNIFLKMREPSNCKWHYHPDATRKLFSRVTRGDDRIYGLKAITKETEMSFICWGDGETQVLAKNVTMRIVNPRSWSYDVVLKPGEKAEFNHRLNRGLNVFARKEDCEYSIATTGNLTATNLTSYASAIGDIPPNGAVMTTVTPNKDGNKAEATLELQCKKNDTVVTISTAKMHVVRSSFWE